MDTVVSPDVRGQGVFGRLVETFYDQCNAELVYGCLFYTSDAADDLLCVDLGGRRLIKKNSPLYQSHPT